ncbi:MAG: response regulator transcription factor [Bacteroidales bacterium]
MPQETTTRSLTQSPIRARLLLADDNPRMFEQLLMMLGRDFDIVARASTGREAVSAALEYSPDALILDISMPIMSGLRAAEQLRDKGCHFPVVFLTVHEDEEYVRAAQEAGALGYVLKSQMASDLVPAIRAALEGQQFVSRSLAH